MIDYWHFTNDSSYNPTVSEALLSQVGPDYDYMVPIRAKEEGNDDQAFWGFATMSAAEHNFTAPNASFPSWFQLTENLWNTQAARWDTTSCGGGLKWQIFSFNAGYDYKNSVSNGAFFQLSARLARFTGNSTYIEWANKAWQWSESIGLIDARSWAIYDGTDDTTNCTSIDHTEWTYSVGIYTYGAAVMYNISNGTTASTWRTRTESLINASIPTFFSPYANATDILYEPACETIQTCNYDQRSFKAYLARFFWASTKVAAFTIPLISQVLETSAIAAANTCTGQNIAATDGTIYDNACGAKWYVGGFDGSVGPGQQLSVLEMVQGLLTNVTSAPGVGNGSYALANSTGSVTTTAAAASTSKSAGLCVGVLDGASMGEVFAGFLVGFLGCSIMAFGLFI